MPCWYRLPVNFAHHHFCLQTVFIYKCHVIWWSVRSFHVSFVCISFRLIKLTNDTRNEPTNYTNETQMNRRRTNDTRKRNEQKWYEISVNLKRSRICSTCAGECDWLFHWQHKLCVTFSANVNINYRLPIKVYYHICTYQNQNNSWKPECVLSLNMGLRILANFIPRLWLGIKY